MSLFNYIPFDQNDAFWQYPGTMYVLPGDPSEGDVVLTAPAILDHVRRCPNCHAILALTVEPGAVILQGFETVALRPLVLPWPCKVRTGPLLVEMDDEREKCRKCDWPVRPSELVLEDADLYRVARE